MPDSLKPTKKVKNLSKSESVSSEEDIDTEAKLMEEVKRKSLAEHQAMSSQMDKENKEMEMAIAKSIVDQQRLQNEKKTQEDILEHQMKKLSMKEVNEASSSNAGKIITHRVDILHNFSLIKEGACHSGNLMSKKFKKRFLIPCESHSSSEEKDDGLFTATDVIKEEVKKLENRLSDQDLLDIKRKTMAKEDVKNWHESKKQVIECSEPLTRSIMSMRAMPVSKLLSKRVGYQESPRSSASSSIDLKDVLNEPKGTLDDDHMVDLKELINLEEQKTETNSLQGPIEAEQKDPSEEPKEEPKEEPNETPKDELKDPKAQCLKITHKVALQATFSYQRKIRSFKT